MTNIQLIPLTCPSCGASVNVPEGATRYTCGYCGNEHLLVATAPYATASYATASYASASNAASAPQITLDSVEPAAARPRVPQPASVEIVRDGEGARIVQRWFSWKVLPLAFFAVCWDGFLCFWYFIAINGGDAMMLLFPMIHVAVGVGITYSALAGFLNRTNIELNRDELRVWIEPLPWLGKKNIPIADIKQLYCKETVSHGKNGSSYHYHLYAITRDDRQVKLVSNLDSADVDRFLEQQLEDWLLIKNQPVVGEM